MLYVTMAGTNCIIHPCGTVETMPCHAPIVTQELDSSSRRACNSSVLHSSLPWPALLLPLGGIVFTCGAGSAYCTLMGPALSLWFTKVQNGSQVTMVYNGPFLLREGRAH